MIRAEDVAHGVDEKEARLGFFSHIESAASEYNKGACRIGDRGRGPPSRGEEPRPASDRGASQLEHEGWITAESRPSENNRRAKFYSLTRLGRRQLEREAQNWSRLSAAITQIVRLEEA
ncbi:MAG: helix-turn-helix transcriptional regulator [Acidobacteriota bacterium]|nr:helix-turn-helix transcriptional regulator [Acidobacteriota bacterium]